MRGAVSTRRRRLLGLVGGSLLGAPLTLATAAGARLDAATIARAGQARLRFELGGEAEAALEGVRVFGLEAPERLVIDLPATTPAEALAARRFEAGVVAGLRYGAQSDGTLRVVVDLRRPVRPRWRVERGASGAALVVDLGVPLAPPSTGTARRARESTPLRDVLVAIDPGHGGRDPGAVGPRETLEKDVVLDISRRLYRQLAATRGVTPTLTRESDVYVELADRIGLARERRADLFVSVHADAFPRREARGSSVYALSLDGASSEAAAWLARSENESAALYGSVALEGLGAGLRETLLDLAQTSTLEESLDVGATLLGELGQVGALHKPRVEQANFAVLRSPDIPSVLVETAFISNPDEERKLGDPAFRERLAMALRAGLAAYLARAAPAGTLLHAARG